MYIDIDYIPNIIPTIFHIHVSGQATSTGPGHLDPPVQPLQQSGHRLLHLYRSDQTSVNSLELEGEGWEPERLICLCRHILYTYIYVYTMRVCIYIYALHTQVLVYMCVIIKKDIYTPNIQAEFRGT